MRLTSTAYRFRKPTACYAPALHTPEGLAPKLARLLSPLRRIVYQSCEPTACCMSLHPTLTRLAATLAQLPGAREERRADPGDSRSQTARSMPLLRSKPSVPHQLARHPMLTTSRACRYSGKTAGHPALQAGQALSNTHKLTDCRMHCGPCLISLPTVHA